MPDRQFGRIPSPIDGRDWDLGDFIPHKYSIRQEMKWDFPCIPLDQGVTNHCVGYAMAHFGINLPTFTRYTKEDASQFYYKCKIVDGFPEAEDGTTIRSAGTVLQEVGAINNYAFAKTTNQIKWWLLNKGPLIVGTLWTEKMMYPDQNGILDITGFVLGGHGYIINELTKDNYYGIKNSWGPNWGKNGKAYISVADFERIFSYGGEALAAVELENYKAQKDHWLTRLVNLILDFLRSLRAKTPKEQKDNYLFDNSLIASP